MIIPSIYFIYIVITFSYQLREISLLPYKEIEESIENEVGFNILPFDWNFI